MPSENGKPSGQEMERLFHLVSQKLGMSEKSLKDALADKSTAKELLKRVGGEKAERALHDPKALQDLLKKNAQAKKIYNDLTKEETHGGE